MRCERYQRHTGRPCTLAVPHLHYPLWAMLPDSWAMLGLWWPNRVTP